jgi:hypothetical protein
VNTTGQNSAHSECVRCATPRRLSARTEQTVHEAVRRGEQLRAEEAKRKKEARDDERLA